MLRVLELFGGIGACSKALERLGVDFEIADYVEIDKAAVKSFNAIHGTAFSPQDISKWDKNIQIDLIMHGSPCQDFSLEGKLKGGDEGSGTRSSLMYETLRIVDKLKPKYVIWENVRNLLSQSNIHNFNKYLMRMEQLGYGNYYQVLNAKDYGIPQNRERVFTVSIRSDIDKGFLFPPKQQRKNNLLDFCDLEASQSYNLSEKTIKTVLYESPVLIETNALLIKNATKKGYLEANIGDCVNLAYPNSNNRRGRVGKGIAHTLLTNCNLALVTGGKNSRNPMRYLTPKEYWRLMGFDEEDYNKAAGVTVKSSLYKQAGNSIVVNVLQAILTQLLLKPPPNNERWKQLNLFN